MRAQKGGAYRKGTWYSTRAREFLTSYSVNVPIYSRKFTNLEPSSLRNIHLSPICYKRMENILIVADDLERQLLVTILERAGYTTVDVRDGSAGVRKLLDNDPFLVVIAEETAPVNGTAYLQFISNLTTAVIIVVGWGGESTISHALFQGADGYVTRPINGAKFLARTRSLLRRKSIQTSGTLRTPFQTNIVSRKKDECLNLTPVEKRLLRALLNKEGGVASRKELSKVVWPGRGKDTSLRFHISCLRRKLASSNLGEILTQRGRGYSLRLHDPRAIRMTS